MPGKILKAAGFETFKGMLEGYGCIIFSDDTRGKAIITFLEAELQIQEALKDGRLLDVEVLPLKEQILEALPLPANLEEGLIEYLKKRLGIEDLATRHPDVLARFHRN